ncbi:hypothetical protein KP79_PYT21235 [Mizuhopecten yessoensis]|uniref:Uncharacterized protein n=1 Tax=Mizuhopecten yessoensis TaxID=6573 RepID=A0A210QDC6_MIZYE|nr:hypothetical protein KP79_PYT21235 [Mizuhopecten yessoensis]
MKDVKEMRGVYVLKDKVLRSWVQCVLNILTGNSIREVALYGKLVHRGLAYGEDGYTDELYVCAEE